MQFRGRPTAAAWLADARRIKTVAQRLALPLVLERTNRNAGSDGLVLEGQWDARSEEDSNNIKVNALGRCNIF